jgi:hypothetical protein
VGTLSSELGAIARELADAPRVYVDANVPAGLVATMRQDLGWDVLFVMEHDELRRASDEEHFRRANDYARTLITLDHDFFDERRFPPDRNPGVVVCSAPDERGLARLLRDLHRSLLGAPGAQPMPLKGRTVELVPGRSHSDV